MDIHDFVTLATNQAAAAHDSIRQLHTWYLWGDKRPGEPTDRFMSDVAEFAKREKMYQRKPQ